MTNSQTMTTAAHPAALWDSNWLMFLARMMAMTKCEKAMPRAPMERTGLRPSLSMYKTAGIAGEVSVLQYCLGNRTTHWQ